MNIQPGLSNLPLENPKPLYTDKGSFDTAHSAAAQAIAPNLTPNEIKSLSWLQNPPNKLKPGSAELKMIASEIYDFNAAGTSFQDIRQDQALKRFNDVCEALPSFQSSPSLSATLPLLKKCANISEELTKVIESPAETRAGSLQNFSKDISQQIIKLPVNGRILLPGGWSGKGATSLLYCIERESKKSFKFTIINTNAAIQFHPSATDSEAQLRYQTFLTINSIKEEKFNPEFVQALFEPIEIPNWDPLVNYNHEIIYNQFIAYLQGTVEKGLDPSKFSPFFSKPQRSNSSAMKSLFAAMRYFALEKSIKSPQKMQKDLDAYKRFRFSYRRHALLELCTEYFKDSTPWNRTLHKVISDTTSNISKAALKLANNKLLSQEELKACEATVADIRSHLAIKKLHGNKKNTVLSDSLPINIGPQNSYLPNKTILLDKKMFINLSRVEKNEASESILSTIPKAPTPLTPQNIGDYLKSWAKVDYSKIPNDQLVSLHDAVINAMRLIPIPKSEKDDFWTKVPQEQIDSSLEGLFKLSGVLVSKWQASSIWSRSTNYNNSSSVFIETQAALAIADRLSRRKDENKLNDYKLPIQHILRFAQTTKVLIHNPIDQARFDQILAYFAPDIDQRLNIPKGSLQTNPKTHLFAIYEGEIGQFKNPSFNEQELTVNSDTYKDIVEFRFYAQFLNDESVVKALKEKNLENANLQDKIAFIATAFGADRFLPKGAYYLRNIAYAAQTADPTRYSVLGVDAKFNNFEFVWDLRKPTNLANPDHKYGRIVTFSPVDPKRPTNRLNNRSFNRELNGNYESTIQNETMSEYAAEAVRNKEILLTNAHDEIIRYLAFMESQPEGYLEQQAAQESLTAHLFRPGRLLRLVTDEPVMAGKLMAQLNRRLDFFIASGKWEAALMVLDICNRCAGFIKYARKTNPEKYTDLKLRDYGKTVVDVILPKCRNDEIQRQALEVLDGFSVSYIDELNDEQSFIDYAVFSIESKISQLTNYQNSQPNYITTCFLDSKSMAKVKFQRRLGELFSDPNKKAQCNLILNKVASFIAKKEVNKDWTKTAAGNWVFESGDMTLNLDLGSLKEGTFYYGSLPIEITKKFGSIFKDIKQVKLSNNDNTYVVEDSNGTTEIIITERQRSTHQSKDYFTDKVTEVESEYCYVQMNRIIDGKEYNLIETNRLNIPSNLNSNVKYGWLCTGNPTSNHTPHVLIQNENSTFYFDSKISNVFGYTNFNILSISDRKDRSRVLVDALKLPEYQILQNFTGSADAIRCWAKKDTPEKLNELEMTSLNLNFYAAKDANGTEQLFSRELTGFYISRDQLNDNKAKWPDYLVLENNRGDKKVIMRKLEQGPFAGAMYDAKDPKDFDPSVVSKNYSSKETAIYDYVQIAGKMRLKASSIYDSLYLTKILLGTKRFKQAAESLKDCQWIFLFTEAEKQLIQDIFASNMANASSSALPILLRLIVMLEENHLKYGPKDEKFAVADAIMLQLCQPLAAMYVNYLNNLHNINSPLTLEEEKTILRLISRVTVEVPVVGNISALLMAPPVIIRRVQEILNPSGKNILEENVSAEVAERRVVDSYEINSFELMEWFKGADAPAQIPTLFTKITSDEFKNKFIGFYKLARNGSQQERDRLSRVMRFLAQSDNSLERKCFFLIAVCEKPKDFPDITKVSSITNGTYDTRYSFAKKIEKAIKKTAAFNELIKEGTLSALLQAAKQMTGTPGVSGSLLQGLKQKIKLQQFANQIVGEKPVQNKKSAKRETLSFPAKLDELDAQWISNFDNISNAFAAAKNGSLADLQKNLKKQLDDADPVIKAQEQEIITLINALRPDATVIDALKKQERREKPKLTLDDAIALLEKGSAFKYRLQTSLSDAQIKEVEQKLAGHMINVTRLAQIKRIHNLIAERATSDEKDIIDAKIEGELKSPRMYKLVEGDDALKRGYLVFEYRNEILLRKKQVDTLDYVVNLTNLMDLLLELGTGSGKSKVLAPLMQRLRETDNKAVFNLWPSALYNVNKRDMRDLVKKAFGQRSDTFEFTRESSIERDKLLVHLRELVASLVQGRQLNATPESIQACELKFLEVLHIAANRGEGYPEEALPLLQEILNFIYSSEAHIDEGHINLSPRREVNFTVGDPETLQLDRVDLMELIFRFMTTNPELVKLLGIRDDRQRFVTPEAFKATVAPKLAEHFISELDISDSIKASYMDYVQGIKTDISWLEKHPKRDLIVLLREHITFLLPEVLQKSVGVNYGLSHHLHDKGGVEYAKPYSGNDAPVENAEYDNIYETYDKTYLTYLYRGLDDKQVYKLVQFLQTQALKTARETKVDPRNTDFHKFYIANFPAELGDLFSLGPKDVESYVDAIKKNDEVVLYYIKNLIAPTIKRYNYKLKSTSQNLHSMFNSSMAMTATPGQEELYSDKIKMKRDEGNDKLVLDTITKKCLDPKTIKTLNASKPAAILDEMKEMFSKDKDFRMLIDIGALLKGINNLTVAQVLLDHYIKNRSTSEIRGIVFFDKDDRLMILEENRSAPIPLEQSGLSPKERFTYCDQRHSFGADIPQYHNAKALATMDKNSDKDAVVQGVGRLRQFLGNGQMVEWALTKEVKDIIQPKGQATIKDLLDFSIQNQNMREMEDLRRSLKQQMANEVRSLLMKKLLACTKQKDMIDLFKDFESILVEKLEDLSGEQFEKEPTVENLHRYCDALITKTQKLVRLSAAEKNQVKTKLESYKPHITKLKSRLPEFTTSRSTDLETEAEIQQNVETNTETNVQQQVVDNTDLFLRTPILWPKDFSFYDNKWLSPSSPRVNFIANTIALVVRKTLAAIKNTFSNYMNVAWSQITIGGKIARISLLAGIVVGVLGTVVGSLVGLSYLAYKVAAIAIAALALLPPLYGIPIGIAGGALILGGIGLAGYFGVKKIKAKILGILKPELPTGNQLKRGKSAMPLFRADELLKLHHIKDVAAAKDLMAPTSTGEILFTNNFVTRKPNGMLEFAVTPLSKEQKPAFEVLVIQDDLGKDKKKWTVIVGDQSTDAMFWREELELDCKKTKPEDAAKRKRKVCLYDLTLGVVKNGAVPFNEDKEMSENEELQSLIAKVKLYNADTSYTPMQQTALEKMSKDPVKLKMMQSLMTNALTWHDEKQKGFPVTWIAKLLFGKTGKPAAAASSAKK